MFKTPPVIVLPGLMPMRTWSAFVTALLATASLAVLAPTAAADHGPTTCTIQTYSPWDTTDVDCTFACHKGDYLTYSGSASNPIGLDIVDLTITCGGISIRCFQGSPCSGNSLPRLVEYDDVGTCVIGTAYTTGTCTSVPTPLSAGYALSESRSFGASVPALGVPYVPPTPVGTPGLPQVCTPANIVCVGPVAPITVLTTPPVGPIPLTEETGASVSFEDPVITPPGVGSETIGPIIVSGDPVPVVLCASTCVVPFPEGGGVDTTVTVTVYYGTLEESVTLP